MSEEHIEVTETPKVIPLSDLPVVQKYQPPIIRTDYGYSDGYENGVLQAKADQVHVFYYGAGFGVGITIFILIFASIFLKFISRSELNIIRDSFKQSAGKIDDALSKLDKMSKRIDDCYQETSYYSDTPKKRMFLEEGEM